MSFATFLKMGLSASLDSPIIECLGQRLGNKAISIVQQHFTFTAFEMAETYQNSYRYALAAICTGLAGPTEKLQFIQKLTHSKIQREFADQIETDYFQPYAAQQGVQGDVAVHQLRTQLIDSIQELKKGPAIFTAEQRQLTEAELAAAISYQGRLAITDLVLEQMRQVHGQLESQGLADWFRFNELLGNAVLFFVTEIVRRDRRAKTTLQLLQNQGLWADLRELKPAQQRLETRLQQQLDEQTALLKAAVDAKDFAQVTLLSSESEQLQQSMVEVPQQLQAAKARHQSLRDFAGRFDGWAELLDEKVDNVLAAMDELHGTVIRIDDNVQDLVAKMDLLMQRLELSEQIQARDEFVAHSSASLALIEQARVQLKGLPTKVGQSHQLALKAGSLLFSTGQPDNLAEAERLFVEARNCAKVSADKALACFNLFQVRLRRKAYDDALADLQCAIEIDPNYALHDRHKYPIVRILGAGGMGCVFLCHDQWGEGREVVVKCFWEGRQGTHQQVFGEAMIMRKIAGDYVPTPLDSGYVNAVQQEKPFFVTEYIDGALDGETWLETHQPLNTKTGLAVGLQIAKGLNRAHQQRIYHLDMKPANVLFRTTTSGLVVKIIDFGLARVATSLKQSALSRRSAGGMTQMAQGIFFGTLYYAPPEQLGETRYGTPSAKSDLFSFGATLYRLMTKESPQNLNPLRLADAPPALFQLLCECKEENPKRRPESAQQLVARLEAIQAEANRTQRQKAVQPKPGRTISPEPQRKVAKPDPVQPAKTKKRGLLVFAVVVVLIGLVWFNRSDKEPREKMCDKPGQTEVFCDRLKDGSLGPEMVWISAGRFKMGDIQRGGYDDEQPVHHVSVERFAMGKYELTVEEFRQFVNATGYQTNAETEGRCYTWAGDSSGKSWHHLGFSQTDNDPVVCISWNDATAYLKWLSEQTGHQYRLPTEAQWEYAARAGTETKYWWGNDIGSNNANCYDDYCGDHFEYTAPVGSFKPNPYGLYDTAGNVWEWTCSEYQDKYNGQEQQCVESAGRFVVRSGSWFSGAGRARSAFRYWGEPTERYVNYGVRPARIR